jgi:hypothetical protein
METNQEQGQQTRQTSAGPTERPTADSGGGGTGTNAVGQCACPPRPTDSLPEKGPIRRLMDALDELLGGYEDNPTVATAQLKKDLADCEKEYQGIGDLVKKYEECYATFDCQLSEAKAWQEDIKERCMVNVSQALREQIRTIWEECYEKKGTKLECDWIGRREVYKALQTCMAQSTTAEEEAKGDYEVVMTFKATIEGRFGDLKALYDKAKKFKDAARYQALCAVGLEFERGYKNLGALNTWAARRAVCNDQAETVPLLKNRTPEWYREVLTETLRALIFAKFQKFSWHQFFLESETARDRAKRRWDDFEKDRRNKFIQEAEDAEETASAEQRNLA